MIYVKVNCVSSAVIIYLITVICSVSASDLGWDRSVQTMPSAYYNVSTSNVLRCGKLCERQGKCTAVTFDVRERKCYMHDTSINTNQSEKGSSGRYLIKNYNAESKPDASENTCDEETQINIPTMNHKYGECYNITEKNECKSSPCQNNATCEDKKNDYHCNCQAGYTGKNCSIEINECESSPCQNNATCEDKKNGYHCNCQAGYTGKNCSIEINECECSPCKNNATCEDKNNDYNCNCQAGYTGKDCSVEMNECDSSPCQNNATCDDMKNGYHCNCQVGYTGENCSVESCPTESGYQLWTYSDMTLCIQYSLTSVSNYIAAGNQCNSTGGHLVKIENESMRSHLVDIAHNYGAPTNEWTYLNGRKNPESAWIDWNGNDVIWLSWARDYPNDKACLISKVQEGFHHIEGYCTNTRVYLLCQIDI